MKKLEWTTTPRKVNDLLALEINPRKITDSKRKELTASLEKFNLADIPVINYDNTILSGHQRVAVLQLLGRGEELIDVRCPNRKLTTAEAKEYMLIANTHSGTFDLDALQAEFADIDLSITGLNLKELEFTNSEAFEKTMDTFFKRKEAKELKAKEDDYQPPERIQTDIVPGDLFTIGPHRLLCGDSTDSDAVAKLMDGEKADMLTDPPYGIDINMNMGRRKVKPNKFENKNWDKSRPDFFYLCKMFENLIIWGGNYFADNLPISKNWLCWYKKTNGLSFGEFELAWTNCNINTRILSHAWGGENKLHPTMKPVVIMGWCLEFLTSETIFDPFLGSGSTMVACHQLNRKCYGIELDPHYCQVIIERMLKLDATLTLTRNGQPWKPVQLAN
jgi:DNA modification methylase